jgi:chromosome segregation ATPase
MVSEPRIGGEAAKIGEIFAGSAQGELNQIKSAAQDAQDKLLKDAQRAQDDLLNNFKVFEKESRDHIAELTRSVSEYQREQRDRIEEKFDNIETRISSDFKTRLYAVIGTVVLIAGGGAIASFQTLSHEISAQVREVNSDVMQLQTATIAAKDRIEKSTDTLSELTSKLKGIGVELEHAHSDYNTTMAQLNAARAEYDNIVKEIRKTSNQKQ